MELTTDEVAAAVAGEVFGRGAVVRGAGIDSRTVAGGELFVPIVAERDGHDFIGAALAAGAGAYLTSGPIEAGTGVRTGWVVRLRTGLCFAEAGISISQKFLADGINSGYIRKGLR